MRKVNITRLRNHFSRYIDQVKGGESILVMNRNQPVARIIPLVSMGHELGSAEARLTRLERKGLIRRGTRGSIKWLLKRRPPKLKGSVLQDFLDERRTGW